MEDLTCMEYLLHCAGNNEHCSITQDILLNASNEFRNIWNLVKKLQAVARIDVRKITKFLDSVQDSLTTKKWETASILSVYADHEYKQIRKYIRATYLEEYKIIKYIEHTTTRPNKKSQKNSNSLTVHRGKQIFRNRQIYNQKKNEKLDDKKDNKESKDTKESIKKDGDNTDEAESQAKNNPERREIGDGQEHIYKDIDDSNADIKQNDTSIKANDFSQVLDSVNKPSIISAKENKEKSLTTKDPYNVENDLNKDTTSAEEKSLRVGNEKLCTKSQDEQLSRNEVLDITGQTINRDNDLTKLTNKKEHPYQDVKFEAHHMSKEINQAHEDGLSLNSTERHDGKQTAETCQDDLLDNHIKSEEGETKPNNSESETKHYDNASNCKSEDKDVQKQDVIDKVNDETKLVDDNSNSEYDTCTLITKRVTNISEECDADEVIEELANTYEHDWNSSFKSLTSCQPSNGLKNSISFLGEILKVSSLKTKQKVERLLKSKPMLVDEVNDELTKEKEEFLKKQFQDLQREFRIITNDSDGEYIIKTYAAKCVELAWFMCIQDPPLVFDYDSRPMLPEDLYKLFKPYRHRGKLIQYVIWPAIRRAQTGEVVAQGIADFR